MQRDYLRRIDVNDNAEGVSVMEVYRLFIAREHKIHLQMNKLMRTSERSTLSNGLIWVPHESDLPATLADR